MTNKLFTVHRGDICVECLRDTSFGSGLFVNRIPGDTTICNEKGEETGSRTGYFCAQCMAMDCDRCANKIPLDEDFTPYQIYGETSDVEEFSDGAYRICEDCLTPKEKQLMEELNNEI